jgi:hypothetical protein
LHACRSTLEDPLIVFEDSDAGIVAASLAGLTVMDVKPPFNFESIVIFL